MRLLLLALLVVGCGGQALPLVRSYDVTYTLLSAEGSCPPYAPERLQLGPRITGDPTCVWAPFTESVGLNLLCGFDAPTSIEPLSWEPDGTGTVRIGYPPVCSGIYGVRVEAAR
jgi:hypothetical protein